MSDIHKIRQALENAEHQLKIVLSARVDRERCLSDLKSKLQSLTVEAISIEDAAAIAMGFRLLTLVAMFQGGFLSQRGLNAARLRGADRLLRQALQSPDADRQWLACEHAKLLVTRATLLDRHFEDRSSRGLTAAHRCYLDAARRFDQLALLSDSARQFGNAAAASFRLGRLSDPKLLRRSSDEYQRALAVNAPDILPSERAAWSTFSATAIGELSNIEPDCFMEALDAFEDVMATAERDGKPDVRILFRLNFAGLLMTSHRHSWRRDAARAEHLLNEALDMAGEESELAPSIHLSLCSLWLSHPGGALTPNIETAIHHGERALAWFSERKQPAEESRAARMLAEAWAMRVFGERKSNGDRARQLACQALSAARRAANQELEALAHSSAGRVEMLHAEATEQWREATEHLRSALALWKQDEVKAGAAKLMLAHALLSLHWKCEDGAPLEEATNLAKRVAKSTDRETQPEARRRALVTLGDCAGCSGQWDIASRYYDEALTIEGQSSITADAWSATQARSLGSAGDSFKRAAFARWRCGDPLGALERFINGVGRLIKAAGRSPARKPLDSFNDLSSHQVVIAPLFTPNGAALIVARRIDGLLHVEGLELQSETEVKLLERLLGSHLGTAGWLQHLEVKSSRRLAEMFEETVAWMQAALIAPIEKWLLLHRSIGRIELALLPSALSILPWQAAIALQPDWRLFQALDMARDSLGESPTPRKLLLIPDPTCTLRAANSECLAIEKNTSGPAVWIHPAGADTDSIMRGSRDATRIHFAGHARFDPYDLSKAELVLRDGIGLSADIIASSFHLEHRPLVTLAGCETGITDVVERGSEAIGLPTAWLVAGAGAVVGAQWRTSDSASALLNIDLHRRLESGTTLLDALHESSFWLAGLTLDQALKELNHFKLPADDLLSRANWLNAPRGPFDHPFFWAAYTAFRPVGDSTRF